VNGGVSRSCQTVVGFEPSCSTDRELICGNNDFPFRTQLTFRRVGGSVC
jgi:hypothetical protein